MDYSKPTLIVISGPNGAGKSTHAQTMLPSEFDSIVSFDRDNTRVEFEKQLHKGNDDPKEVFRIATRMMEQLLTERMRGAIAKQEHFVLETPLSHPDYWLYVDMFTRAGYQIQLNYLCLDKVSDCIARVGQRVLEGGHYVEPKTIKGVYEKNLEHINDYYASFRTIELYDGMKIPTLLAKMEDGEIVFAQKAALQKKWIKAGLPAFFEKIRESVKKLS